MEPVTPPNRSPAIRAIILLAFFLTLTRVYSFALLGPFEPWMDLTNGFDRTVDIGGPMDINAEYRWNVPVVTYGFDPSFIDFFGSNGVAAVQQAIQIFNDLPPASSLVLTNFPTYTQGINYAAQASQLFDLKSQTLSLLIEQLGLAPPERSVFILRQWDPRLLAFMALAEEDWVNWAYPDYIFQRNYDPETLAVSHDVNGTRYSGVGYWTTTPNPYPAFADVVEFPVDPLLPSLTAVADQYSVGSAYPPSGNPGGPGYYFVGLTRDDVGGLSYLLGTNNYNLETLLPDVHGTGTNAANYVNLALRSGVDKITFVPQPFNPSLGFLPATNQFTDTYVSNNILIHQQLERVVTQPDFLFCAGDVGSNTTSAPFYFRTGTTNWLNCAAANGSPTDAGPGIIRPHIKIIFQKLGQRLFSSNTGGPADIYTSLWATFDSSTNTPIIYPAPSTGTNQSIARLWMIFGSYPDFVNYRFDWPLSGPASNHFLFQSSSNLVNWSSEGTITNDGSIFTYLHRLPVNKQQFFRVTPE